jgi:hypothetical protein
MASVGILINISRQTLSEAELAPRRASSTGAPPRPTRRAHPIPATNRSRARQTPAPRGQAFGRAAPHHAETGGWE